MKWISRASLVLFLLLPLVGIVDAGLDIHRVVRVPDMTEWKSAADTVRKAYKKGDIIHFQPYWADEGWRFFRGMDIDVVQDMNLNELSTYKRVWVIAAMSGLPFHVPSGFQPLMNKKHGRVHVILLKPERGQRMVFDLMQGLKYAKVSRIYKNRVQKCKNFRDNRWYCGAVHPWQYVGELVRDVAGSPRRVIWAHPLNHGNKIEIKYPNLPAGRQLEVDYGWSQRAIESDKGQPVQFQIYADGKIANSIFLKKTNHKWNRILIALDPKAKVHNMKFIIRTRNHKDRQFCFKGWLFK